MERSEDKAEVAYFKVLCHHERGRTK